MPRKKTEQLVRYVSPFGTPAWMPRKRAEAFLEEDDRRYVEWQKLGILSPMQRAVGPPRIGDTTFSYYQTALAVAEQAAA